MKGVQCCLLTFIALYFFSSGIVSAQTMICRGDTAVLILEGYKRGATYWQQSINQTAWLAAVGASYNDSLIVAPTNNYYYRAIVKDGTCDSVTSDPVLVIMHPAPTAPVANQASNITMISFDASWSTPAGAVSYILDVATDSGFTSFAAGYNGLDVGKVTTFTVNRIICGVTYYYRVRVKNKCDKTSNNSNTIEVIMQICPDICKSKSTCSGNINDSRDNNIYPTVQIGSQCWMAQNLNVGKQIPGIQPQSKGTDDQDTSIEKYCWGDDPNNCVKFGGLYSWEEMMAYGLSDAVDPGPRGICPTGWHIPTETEWNCLEETLGGNTENAGGKLKDTSTLWSNPNKGATNSSGFSALPGGSRVASGMFSYGGGTYGYWWTATEDVGPYSWSRYLCSNCTEWDHVTHYHAYRASSVGFSVRCVKD